MEILDGNWTNKLQCILHYNRISGNLSVSKIKLKSKESAIHLKIVHYRIMSRNHNKLKKHNYVKKKTYEKTIRI